MSSNYWIKLYHDILDDPKMGRMPDRLWRRTIEMFLLAGEMSTRDGILPAVSDMAWRLRVTDDELTKELEELSQIGIVRHTGLGWTVANFKARQSALTSTERTRLQRKRDREKEFEWIPFLVSGIPAEAGIYAIRCKNTNKHYIGGSKNMKRRVSDHLREITQTPYHAISADYQEFGPESLEVMVIESVESGRLLKKREAYWMSQYSVDLLYNKESSAKRHRDWPETIEEHAGDDVETDRLIDTEEESETESETKTERVVEEEEEAPAPPTRRPLPLPRTVKQAIAHPDLALIKRVSGVIPGETDYASVIDAVQLLRTKHPDEAELEQYLGRFWVTWSGRKSTNGRDYSRTNPAWLTEWAINDHIPPANAPPSANGKSIHDVLQERAARGTP